MFPSFARLSFAEQAAHPVFTAHFRKAVGLPPKQYISMRRINRAKQLLVSTNDPIKQIALNSGFKAIDLFYRLFWKYALELPEEFRRHYRMKNQNTDSNESGLKSK